MRPQEAPEAWEGEEEPSLRMHMTSHNQQASKTLRDMADRPIGLAAVAGALAEWEDIDEAVEEIYAARRDSCDRPAPDLGEQSHPLR